MRGHVRRYAYVSARTLIQIIKRHKDMQTHTHSCTSTQMYRHTRTHIFQYIHTSTQVQTHAHSTRASAQSHIPGLESRTQNSSHKEGIQSQLHVSVTLIPSISNQTIPPTPLNVKELKNNRRKKRKQDSWDINWRLEEGLRWKHTEMTLRLP